MLPLLFLVGCQSISTTNYVSLPELDTSTYQGATLQLSAMKCFLSDLTLIQDEIEKDTGISFRSSYNLQSKGYEFKNVSCNSLSIYKNKATLTAKKNHEESVALNIDVENQKRQELFDKISRLDNAGNGSLKICTLGNRSTANVYYDNNNGKRVVLRIYDEHIINSVYLYLNKKQAKEFITIINNADEKAQDNSDLESLNLGRYSSGKNWVMLSSRYGSLSGFWGNDWVDRVLLPVNAPDLTKCIEKVLPSL